MGATMGQELSQQSVQLRTPGRGPEGREQSERHVSKAPAQLVKAEKGRWVSPVKVLHRQNHRRGQAEPLNQRQHSFQDPEPERRRLGERQRAPDRVAVPDEQVTDFRALRIRRRGAKVQGLDQRPEGPISIQLRRRPDVGLEPQSSGTLQDFSQKPRLTDPRLALDEADLAGAFGRPAEQRLQGGQL